MKAQESPTQSRQRDSILDNSDLAIERVMDKKQKRLGAKTQRITPTIIIDGKKQRPPKKKGFKLVYKVEKVI